MLMKTFTRFFVRTVALSLLFAATIYAQNPGVSATSVEPSKPAAYIFEVIFDSELSPTSHIEIVFPAAFNLNNVVLAASERIDGMLSVSSKKNSLIIKRVKAQSPIRAGEVVEAWRWFTRGYANYPLTNLFQYFGPMHDGPVWPLLFKPMDAPLAPTWQIASPWSRKPYPPSGDRIGECMMTALSLDEGRTWTGRHDLETEEGRYSYPTLMQASDGWVHLVYTWRRLRIRHVCFDSRSIAFV